MPDDGVVELWTWAEVADEADDEGDDFSGLEWREGAKKLHRTARKEESGLTTLKQCAGPGEKGGEEKDRKEGNARLALQQLLPHPPKLRDHTQHVQPDSPRQQEVPQLEHLAQRRSGGAKGEKRGEGVDFGGEVEGLEVGEEGRVKDGE
jgi:hypothetical protein